MANETDENFFNDSPTISDSSEVNNLDSQLNSEEVQAYKCSLCHESFPGKDQLLKHFTSHSGIQPFQCHICDRKFTRRYVLNEHILQLHSEESECEISSSRKVDLTEHSRDNNNNIVRTSKTDSADKLSKDEPHFCKTCGKAYKHEHLLKRHLRTHFAPFACDICPQKFSLKASLDVHLQNHYVNAFSCELCQKSFRFKNSFHRHLKTHAGDVPFICDKCHKAFPVKILLDSHHCANNAGKKTYECTYCSKKFIFKGRLNIHLQTHPEQQIKTSSIKEKWQNSFKCTFCLKTFSAEIYLKCHLRTHQKEKKLICSICQKEFLDKTKFKEHLCTEGDPKPLGSKCTFECDVCQRTFPLEYILVAHKISHMKKGCLNL